MHILVTNRQKVLPILKSAVKKLIVEVMTCEKQVCDEVSVAFVTKKAIAQLHDQFFGDPTPTDCISFPIDVSESRTTPYKVLGEVFVCPEIAVEYAQRHNANPYHELSLYIIHGLLHLMGYDDMQVEDKKLMRRAERRHMRHLERMDFLLKVGP